MFATALSCALRGLTGVPVTVEADIAAGLPGFTIVGLTDKAIQEARERVRAAVRNAGLEFPARKLTVNLAPAELPKQGTAYDLAIALAALACAGHTFDLGGVGLLGELALDSALRPVAGVLPMARCLKAHGVRRIVVPRENAAEAAMVEGMEVVAAPTLGACVRHLEGSERLPQVNGPGDAGVEEAATDLAGVRGQAHAKRVLEIAAAGGHNMLMLGPPGSGKTMLARAMASLLPDLSAEEALEVAAVWSLRGSLSERSPVARRPPFRSPHHSISRSGLIGGGTGLPLPGEVSMASRGVLFLDEVCEFPRALLEAMRQPLEERRVWVGRARGSVSFPAAFILIAAANPCPCGYRGDMGRQCTCSPRELQSYQARLSGPVRDRLDLVVSVPRQPYDVLFGDAPAEESSAAVRERVVAARERQRVRNARLSAWAPSWAYAPPPPVGWNGRRSAAHRAGSHIGALQDDDRPPGELGDGSDAQPLSAEPPSAVRDAVDRLASGDVAIPPVLNAYLDGSALLAACDPTPEATRLLSLAGERMRLSARAFHRVLRVARTIADLAGEDRVDGPAVAEALRHRSEGIA